MKTVSIIYFFIILSQVLTPCGDIIIENDSDYVNAYNLVESEHNHDHENGEDDCSAFCSCSCCHTVVFNSALDLDFSLIPVLTQFIEHKAFLIKIFLKPHSPPPQI